MASTDMELVIVLEKEGPFTGVKSWSFGFWFNDEICCHYYYWEGDKGKGREGGVRREERAGG